MKRMKKVGRIKRDKDGNYLMTEKQKIGQAEKYPYYRYMIATKAQHEFMGDVSRQFNKFDLENLCRIEKEIEEYYIGMWITGYGFVDVKFPKQTTRPLTDEEVGYFSKKHIVIMGARIPLTNVTNKF